MPGSEGRGGLPSSGCEPCYQALSLIYAFPSFHLCPHPSPRRGSPSSDLSPFSQPCTLEACPHTPFSPSSPPTPTSSRLPAARLSLPALLLRSPPPPSGVPFCPRAPAERRSGNLSSGVPLHPAVPKQRCPGKRRLQLHGLPRGWGWYFPSYLLPAATEPWAQPRATPRVQVMLAQCSA